MITILHRGGYAQMITTLHGGGGSLGTPKSDYVICARPHIGNLSCKCAETKHNKSNNKQMQIECQSLSIRAEQMHVTTRAGAN